jgi:hypothetical protein
MFDLAGASLIGLDHRVPLKEINGQDAVYAQIVPETVFKTVQLCLVADGCGSGLHCEVGAKIGVRLLATALGRQLMRAPESSDPPRAQFVRILEAAREDVLARLRILAQDMGSSFSQTINDYFLFTIVGAILTDDFSVFFSRGDGLIVVNEEEIWIEPEDGNAPVYLAYDLVQTSLQTRPDQLRFDIHRIMATDRLEHFLIGTDGLRFLAQTSHLPLPGKDSLVGPLDQLWDQRMFANTDALRRRLSLINRSVAKPDWEGQRLITHAGHLKDDVAVITGRRNS